MKIKVVVTFGEKGWVITGMRCQLSGLAGEVSFLL